MSTVGFVEKRVALSNCPSPCTQQLWLRRGRRSRSPMASFRKNLARPAVDVLISATRRRSLANGDRDAVKEHDKILTIRGLCSLRRTSLQGVLWEIPKPPTVRAENGPSVAGASTRYSTALSDQGQARGARHSYSSQHPVPARMSVPRFFPFDTLSTCCLAVRREIPIETW